MFGALQACSSQGAFSGVWPVAGRGGAELASGSCDVLSPVSSSSFTPMRAELRLRAVVGWNSAFIVFMIFDLLFPELLSGQQFSCSFWWPVLWSAHSFLPKEIWWTEIIHQDTMGRRRGLLSVMIANIYCESIRVRHCPEQFPCVNSSSPHQNPSNRPGRGGARL